MKTHLLPALRLTLILVIMLGFIYPLIIHSIAYLSKGSGKGATVEQNGRVAGFERIGQSFRSDNYFWGRPSATGYNASVSGGSNKSPSNPEYQRVLQQRIDTFLVHNPAVDRNAIPSELITASGSGLDPDISPDAAFIQIPRIAAARGINPGRLESLVRQHIEKPFLGIFGPTKVNVLNLNIALDTLK
jgi:K+-transporting ATPase ATPase C chain